METKKVFLCPDCKWMGDYLYYKAYVTEYGVVDVIGNHDYDYSDTDETYYSCPNCDAEFWWEDVLLEVEIDCENRTVNISTGCEHSDLSVNEIATLVKNYFTLSDDYEFFVNDDPVNLDSNQENNVQTVNAEILIPFDAEENNSVNYNIDNTKVTLDDVLL